MDRLNETIVRSLQISSNSDLYFSTADRENEYLVNIYAINDIANIGMLLDEVNRYHAVASTHIGIEFGSLVLEIIINKYENN